MKHKWFILSNICFSIFTNAAPQASAEQQTVLIYMLACDLETYTVNNPYLPKHSAIWDNVSPNFDKLWHVPKQEVIK